jgi:uncharacterized membrane protein YgcG
MSSKSSLREFQSTPVSCPGCHRVLEGPAEQCRVCGYNAWTCVDHFPYSPPPLERYVDVENRLSNEDRARLDRSINALERDLPQVRVHVCLVKLLPGTDVRECGFWLLNASIPRDEEDAQHRPWSVLLLMDLTAATASATVGYGLDRFVEDEALRAALAAAKQDWHDGRLAAGIHLFIQELHRALKSAQKLAAKAAAKGTLPRPSPARQPVQPPPPRARHPEL